MANYTTAEIQSAVERIVRSAVRRPYGSLGNRQLNTTFNDYQEAAAGVLVLFSNAPFYIVRLGTERLAEVVANVRETVASLVEAIENTNRPVRPVDDVSSLENARVSLLALETATASRTLGFADIGDVPAFKRFENNTQRFLDNSSSNIRKNGAVVPTPQESRAAIPGLVSTLKEQHAEVVRRATALKGGLGDYSTLNLPALLSRSVIAQARSVIAGRVDELEPLTPQQRLGNMRDTTLDVLAARAVVRNFSSLQPPGTFVLLEGTGNPFADDTRPATPATVLSENPDPWSFRSDLVEDSNELDFTLDGSFSFLLALPGAFPARLDSIVATRRNPDDGLDIQLSVNDALDIGITGFTTVSVTLAADPNKLYEDASASDIVTEINAAIPGSNPVLAESIFQPLRVQTAAIGTTSTGGATADLVRNPGTGDWTSLGVVLNDEVEFVSGTNAGIKAFVSTINAADDIEVTNFSGGAIATATDDEVRVGTRDRFLRLRIKDSFIGMAISGKWELSLPAVASSVEETTLNTLGLIASSTSVSRGVRAEDLKEALDGGTASASNETARLTIEPEFSSNILTLTSGRSVVTNQARVVLFTFRGRVTVDAGSPANIRTTGTGTFAGVVVGDQIVIRTTAIQANQLLTGTVTAVVSTTELTITWVDFSATADTNVLVEISPTALTSLPLDSVLVVNDSVNQGTYRIVGQDAVGIGGSSPTIVGELTLERPMPFAISQSGQPHLFTAQLGRQFVRFSSTDTTTASRIRIFDGDTGGGPNPESGFSKLFSGTSVAVAGTTELIQLPKLPKELEVGDVVEIHTTDPVVPSATHTVVAIEELSTLIQVTPVIDVDAGPLNFSNDSSVPFVRIRKTQKNNFDTFQESTETWLERSENDPQYFRNLDRFINSLTSTTNPTLSEVNTAKVHVQSMDVALQDLTTLLTAYTAQRVDQVDTLVETYVEKGADRATDTLLEGRFTDFFDLDQDSVSYAGAVLSGIKEINREDLPVRKTLRRGLIDQELVLAEFDDVDFEFDQSDIQDSDEALIPGEFFLPKQGDAF